MKVALHIIKCQFVAYILDLSNYILAENESCIAYCCYHSYKISNYILLSLQIILLDLKLYVGSIFNMCFICCRSDKQCPILMDFLRSGIHCASVDITNDRIKMRRTWCLEIPSACHIDLQAIFRLDHAKTRMADMASAVIDEDTYKNMKKDSTVSSTNFGRSTHLTVATLSMQQ